MRRKHHEADEAIINITPMLDIVFILLIFFIVTTSFVKEFCGRHEPSVQRAAED